MIHKVLNTMFDEINEGRYMELYHHGILGQRWGVRRFQNKDGTLTNVGKERKRSIGSYDKPVEDTVLYKGTKLNTVTYWKDDRQQRLANGKWLYTYNKEDAYDNSVYKGPFAAYKSQWGKYAVYERQYELVKDLKMPTKKERVDEFINLYKDKKTSDIVKHDLVAVNDMLNRQGIYDKTGRNKIDINNLKTDSDFKSAYEIFNHAMESVNRFKSTKAYAKAMSKKYDAMVDDNNQGIYNHAHDPIIIFRANKALKKIGDTKYIDYEQVRENIEKVREEDRRLGGSGNIAL